MHRRTAVLAAGLVAVMPLAGALPAAAKAPAKVTVCHVNGANAADTENTYEWSLGREIEVSEKAAEAHRRHGDGIKDDSTTDFYMTPSHRWWDAVANEDGRLVNADCAFRQE